AALRHLYAALRPGGVLLATVPGVSSIDPGEWGETWFWSLTAASAQRLFGDVFDRESVEIAAEGNAFAATCFLQGVALEDIEPSRLRHFDPSSPLVITVRARKHDAA
ncbi:MAG: hypothetical protein ACTHK5_05800, partial [Tsuneonella sp.]